MKHLLAEGRMRHLRVKLDGINLLLHVFHRCRRADARMGGNPVARGRGFDRVRMAHPALAARRHVTEEDAIRTGLHLHFTIFAPVLRGFNLPALQPGDELRAVADAEHRHAERQNPLLIVRRGRIIHAVRPAGEDDALVMPLPELGKRGRIGLHLGINVLLTDAAGNQLIVLAAEIEHQNGFIHAGTTFLYQDKFKFIYA